MIEGKLVSLRPVEREDLVLLDSWDNDREVLGEFNFFGLEGRTGWEKKFEKNGLLDTDHGVLLVIGPGGEAIGMADFRRVDHGPRNGGHAYQLGTHLIPGSRGKGYGAEVASLLAGYLFETYPVMRIEAETDVENLGAQQALEKAGFKREGVLRSAQWQGGGWHDLVLYSKLRGE